MTATTLTLTDFLLVRIAEDEDWGGFAGHETESHQVPCPACRSRVLAECEAKRRIVELREDAVTDQGGVDEDSGGAFSAAYDMACRALASVYADHADYRDEWA